MGLLLPWGVAELLLGPRGGLGVGARVAARRRRPEPAPREAAAVSRRVAAPVRPRSGPVRRRVVRAPVPVPRGGRPRSATARSTPEAAPATPTSDTRAGIRRSRGSKVLSVHVELKPNTSLPRFPTGTAPVDPPQRTGRPSPKQFAPRQRAATHWFRHRKVPQRTGVLNKSLS